MLTCKELFQLTTPEGAKRLHLLRNEMMHSEHNPLVMFANPDLSTDIEKRVSQPIYCIYLSDIKFITRLLSGPAYIETAPPNNHQIQ